MGLSPSEVDKQELWPFREAWEGFKQANGIRESSSKTADLEEADLTRMGIEGFE
ncbi:MULTISPECIES: hypothetical protein [Alphaproteobacteria]|uniref:hypothetical protein n=1 Tax=Alphaproteobacteria TaxID=28211 RepID=UPI001C0A0D32|nr:hypothetical protein [Tritonibacter mobilis]MBU3035979.1 hypothetical protein [Tritonibacter mobilis]WHQ85348.1 hypothetical protein OMR53_21965 [Tritonibacter mobilis]